MLSRHASEMMLGQNRLTSLPSWIGKFHRLQFLDLQGNQLTDLPTDLASLLYLREINITANRWVVCFVILQELFILLKYWISHLPVHTTKVSQAVNRAFIIRPSPHLSYATKSHELLWASHHAGYIRTLSISWQDPSISFVGVPWPPILGMISETTQWAE